MTYQIRGESDKSSSMLLSVRLNFSLSLKVFKVLNVMKVGMVSKEDLKEKRCFEPILVFLFYNGKWKNLVSKKKSRYRSR